MNKQTKHSPAPWGQEATMSSDYTFIRRISDDEGRVIANVRYAQGAEQEENLANARLIAAAPELLEALRKVANCSRYTDPSDTEYALDQLREIAREAIAKATA